MRKNNGTISRELMTLARGFLRISEEKDIQINTEIAILIDACRQDLIRNGITSRMAYNEGDSLITTAILLYLKAEFGLDNKNYERYRSSYQNIRNELALTNDYVSEVEENVG